MQNKQLSHCPYCTQVLFKEASFNDEADFKTRCPHCRKPIMVQVEKEIIIVVKPLITLDISEKEKGRVEKPL